MLASISFESLVRPVLITLIISASICNVHAQQWTGLRKFGAETNSGGASFLKSVTDKEGNTYVVGFFEDKITFDGIVHEAPKADNNAFLVKFNKDGQTLWVSFFNGIGYDNQFSVKNLVVTTSGQVYLTGQLTYEAHFENNVKLIMPPSYGSLTRSPFFICSFNENGTPMWAKFAFDPMVVSSEGRIYSRQRIQSSIKDYSWLNNYYSGWHRDSIYCYKADGSFDRRTNGYWVYELPDVFTCEEGDLWMMGADENGMTKFRRYSYTEDAFKESHLLSIPSSAYDVDMINKSIYIRGVFGNMQTVQIGDITLTAKHGTNGFYPGGFIVKYDMETMSYPWGRTIWKMDNRPTYVAENQNGHVYLASKELGVNVNNDVRAFSAAGDSLWMKQSTSFILLCDGMGCDKYGNVYVTGTASNGVGLTANFPPLSFTYNEAVGYWARITLGYAVPSPPVNLTTSAVTTSSVTLTWQHNSSDETGYRLEYKTGNAATFQVLAQLPANTLSHVANGLACNTAYSFRIVALGQGNSSAPSAVAPVTTPGIGTPVITSSALSGCVGDVITLTAPKGFAETYWNTGATTEQLTTTVGGEFRLVVEDDKHCKSDTGKIKVEIYPYPEATLVSDHTTITLTGTGEYQWYLNGQALDGETSSTINPELSGLYSASVSSHGCKTYSDELEFIVTGIETLFSANVDVFPLPADETVTVRFPDADGLIQLELVSMHGHRVKPQFKLLDEKELVIDTSQLSPGIYLLFVRSDHAVRSFKVVVE